jgi:restriction endonuclease S subunit
MTELPRGWSWVTLEEAISQCKNGLTYRNTPELGGFPVSRIETISKGEIDFQKVGYGGLELKGNEKHLLKPGDILFSHINSMLHVGKVALYKNGMPELLHGMNLLRITPSDDFVPEFLFHLFQSNDVRRQIWSKAKHAVNQASINIGELKTVNVPKPPIKEQHKIVELLEDHLSRLDAALADVKQAKIKTAQFRRSFIHEMTTSIEGSQVMGLLDVCDVYQPKTISTKELISDGKFPVYGANGQIGFYDKFNHDESEVTVTCRGATCGTVNVIPAMSWITGNAMVFRPRDNRIQKGFLEYVLRGMDWTSVITGTAQPQITRTSMQEVYINVPSPEMQREIYMRLESSLTHVTSAGLLSEKVEKQGASLRRSLLQAAFTGQLTNEVVSV